MRNFFSTIFIIHTLLCVAQIKDIPSFINLQENKIYFDKDSSRFMQFIKKIDSLAKGKKNSINIVHFGGSHVQGGWWSEAIMTSLQEYVKGTGGGYFVFPFKQVKSNSPYYFKTYSNRKWKVNKCTRITDTLHYLGMCGISGITDSTCYLSIKNEWKKLQGFTHIKVFHRFNSAYEIIPQFKVSSITNHKNYTEYTLYLPIDSIAFLIQKKDSIPSEFILDGISCDNKNKGVYYAGFGVNGATSESFLKCEGLLHQLKDLKVDVFILSFGVNDVRSKTFTKEEYIQHYDTLIYKLKKAHPESTILLTTISDNYIKRRQCNPRTKLGDEAIFDVMKKHQIAVWDMNAVMGGQKSMLKWYKAGFAAKDKIHFNKKGYFLLGNLMTQAILDKLQSINKK